MKKLLILLMLTSGQLFAQKKETQCDKFKRLQFQADSLKNKEEYALALRKLNSAQIAARNCNPKYEEQVIKEITNLFLKIDQLRQAAENSVKKEKIATQKATIATDNATALYWGAEAGHINPIQGLRLLEVAAKKAKDEKTFNKIKEQTETLFENSNIHKFHKKKRFLNVSSVYFSPDSKWMITSFLNSKSKIWDVSTGKMLNFLQEETDIWEVRFSPDSKWLVITDRNSKSKVWEVSSGKMLTFLQGEINIQEVRFSPDSKWMVTTGWGYKCKVWEVTTGKMLNYLQGETDLKSVSFSPDSKWMATISNHQIITWDVKKRKCIQTLFVNTPPFQTIFLDNRYLFALVGKAVIKMDIETQQGYFFSYGDSEPLNYKYEEIEQWKKVFGDRYLRTMDEETKNKYGISQSLKVSTGSSKNMSHPEF